MILSGDALNIKFENKANISVIFKSLKAKFRLILDSESDFDESIIDSIKLINPDEGGVFYELKNVLVNKSTYTDYEVMCLSDKESSIELGVDTSFTKEREIDTLDSQYFNSIDKFYSIELQDSIRIKPDTTYTISITVKRIVTSITVKADNYTKQYDGMPVSDDVLTYTWYNYDKRFVDDPGFIGKLSATSSINVGTARIIQATLKLVNNKTFREKFYTIDFIKGTITVTPPLITTPM